MPFIDKCAPEPQFTTYTVPGDGGCAVASAARAAYFFNKVSSPDAASFYAAYSPKVPFAPPSYDEYRRQWTTLPVATASADTWFEACCPGFEPTPLTVPVTSPPGPTVGLSDILDQPWTPYPVCLFLNCHGHFYVALRHASQ